MEIQNDYTYFIEFQIFTNHEVIQNKISKADILISNNLSWPRVYSFTTMKTIYHQLNTVCM